MRIFNLADDDAFAYEIDVPIMPGGEPHPTVDPSLIEGENLWIDSRVQCAEDWLRLLSVLCAVKRCRPKSLGLYIPYFPGARQDRWESGGCLTVQLYADMLNRFRLDAVLVLDPHSQAVEVSVRNCHPVMPDWTRLKGDWSTVIAPDAGAAKRAGHVANHLGLPVVQAWKSRDPQTGKLSGFGCAPVGEGRCLLVDDICDGGGTFVGLAQQLMGVSLDLLVTHGIFSKGVEPLAGWFPRIITTDSWVADETCDVERHQQFFRIQSHMRSLLCR